MFQGLYDARGQTDERIHDRALNGNLFLRWLPVLLWALFIFSTSANSNPYRSLPDSVVVPTGPINEDQESRKYSTENLLSPFSHFGEYLVLAALAAQALHGHCNLQFRLLAIGFGMCAFYALTDEIHQLFVAGRSFELRDLGLDLTGSIIGVLLYAFLFKFRKRLLRIG